MFTSVTVDLEEWYIGEIGRSDFDHLCAIFCESTADGWAGNDAAEFEDADARENLRFG